MNKIYEKAVDAILSRINFVSAGRHPDDFECIVDMFNRLLDAGQHVGSDEIYQYITAKGKGDKNEIQNEEALDSVTRNVAGRIQLIYEVLETGRRPSDCWGEDFIKDILRTEPC